MNIVFYLLILIFAILLWFLLAFAFKPIGKLFYKIWEDAVKEINGNDNEENDKKEKN